MNYYLLVMCLESGSYSLQVNTSQKWYQGFERVGIKLHGWSQSTWLPSWQIWPVFSVPLLERETFAKKLIYGVDLNTWYHHIVWLKLYCFAFKDSNLLVLQEKNLQKLCRSILRNDWDQVLQGQKRLSSIIGSQILTGIPCFKERCERPCFLAWKTN